MKKIEKIRRLNIKKTKCKRCELYKIKRCKQLYDAFSAKIMLIAESPLYDRNLHPYNNIIINHLGEDYDLSDDDFLNTNAVKCLVKSNTNISDKQIKECQRFLKDEISILKPKIIMAIGDKASKSLSGILNISYKEPFIENMVGKQKWLDNFGVLFWVHWGYRGSLAKYSKYKSKDDFTKPLGAFFKEYW